MRLSENKIKEQLQFKNGKINNSPKGKMDILPFEVQNRKVIVTEIRGVLGEIFRILLKHEFIGEINITSVLDVIIEKIDIFNDTKDSCRTFFKSILENNSSLEIYNPVMSKYVKSSTKEIQVAEFICSILLDLKNEDIINDILGILNTNITQEKKDILSKEISIVLENLYTKTDNDNINIERDYNYANYAPYISSVFIEDFKFMLNNKDFLIQNIDKLFEHYYMLYVMHVAIKLSKIFDADINENEKIYFIFSREDNIGKNRIGVQYGWKYVSKNLDNLLPHVLCLQLLNCTQEDKEPLTYIDIKSNIVDMRDEEKDEYIKDLDNLINFYIEGNGLNEYEVKSEINKISKPFSESDDKLKKIEYKIKYFINIIKYIYSKRELRGKGLYRQWIDDFAKDKFLSNKGSTGKILLLSEDRILFLIKLCIKNEERIPREELFTRLEKRGVSFDKPSKEELISFLDKSNLIERRSDSEESQYIRISI